MNCELLVSRELLIDCEPLSVYVCELVYSREPSFDHKLNLVSKLLIFYFKAKINCLIEKNINFILFKCFVFSLGLFCAV